MKALLRPLLVTGLSIAIAGAGFANGRALAAGNAAPASVGVVASPTVVVEGDTVTLSVQLDSPATEQVGVQVDWGDFSAPSFLFMSPGQTTIDPPFGHLYVDDVPSGSPEDLMTITVRVDGATTALSASASVLVKNAPPTFTSFTVSPTTITPGHGVTASGVFQDLGKADRHTVSVNWGDGTSTTFPRISPAKTYFFSYDKPAPYTSGGIFTVTARVTDDDTGWAEASAPVTVESTNVAPSNLALAMSPVAEGRSSTLTASFTDPDSGDTHTATVDWGDGSLVETLPTIPAGLTTFAPTHTYGNSGVNTVTVVLKDSADHSITGTTSVTVSNVAPSVSLAAIGSPVAGDTVDLAGTFTDPGTADTFTLSVDWGDTTATGTPVLGADGRSFSASHTYSLPGSYSAVVSVTDRDGGTGTAAATVVVRPRNVPPTNLTLSVPAVTQGATTTVTGTFSDPDASDTHVVVITWGEGTPVTSSLAHGVTSFTATHRYGTAGTWTVSATVTDPASASASATTNAVVTAPATTTAALLDQLNDLVKGFELDRNIERWLTHRISELKASLAEGNGEVCEALHGLDRLSSVARRMLTADQMAAVNDLVGKLQASAQCSTSGDQAGQHQPVIVPSSPKPVSGSAQTPPAKADNGNKNDEQKKNQPTSSSTSKSPKNEQNDQNNSDRGNSPKGHDSR